MQSNTLRLASIDKQGMSLLDFLISKREIVFPRTFFASFDLMLCSTMTLIIDFIVLKSYNRPYVRMYNRMHSHLKLISNRL